MEKGLYDIFADKWYHGGSVYVYSDPHFNDEEMQTALDGFAKAIGF